MKTNAFSIQSEHLKLRMEKLQKAFPSMQKYNAEPLGKKTEMCMSTSLRSFPFAGSLELSTTSLIF